MRYPSAVLALAGMMTLGEPEPAQITGRRPIVAQMARDVTDAVRKQRQEQRERSRAGERTTREGKR